MLGLTPKEVATVLNVSIETIRRRYRDGKLKGYRVGGQIRIAPDQFKEMLGDAYGEFLQQLGEGKEAREPAVAAREPEVEVEAEDDLSALLG